MRRALPAIIVSAGVLASACGGSADSSAAALDTAQICAELARAATPIERRVIETDLIDSTNGEVELRDVLLDLMDRCPNEAAILLGDDRPERPELPVDIEVTRCGADEADGLATNRSDTRADITIEVQFYGRDDVLLDTRSAYVRGLDAGATGRWDARTFGDDRAARCTAAVRSTRPS
jgi:hypothetical protein